MSGLLSGFEECFIQRIQYLLSFDAHHTRIISILVRGSVAAFEFLEIWETVGIRPAAAAFNFDPVVIIACFQRYLKEEGQAVTRAQFEENLARKRVLHAFREDIIPLLRPGIDLDFEAAMDIVLGRIISKLPGDPWRGQVD